MDEDDRYRRVLDEFGKFAREFQDYKLSREKALNDLEQRVIEQITFFWRATAAALRQLADWHAATEAEARTERERERAKRSRQEWIIIALLVFAIVLEVVIRFWR